MHELSIALNLVEIAEAAAREADARYVEAVHLQLGVFSGVGRDALLLAYEIATEDSPLKGSRLIIEELPLRLYCPSCGAEREIENLLLLECPDCGTPCGEITQGKEIKLSFLEISNEPPPS
jgi:hydrogenase nickel incorporation protein HypA/HybF